jgi:putative ABC transport system permease protein
MHTLHRKLLRDLSTLKGQVAAIAVVITAGVMTLIIAVTTLDAISLSKDRFYQDFRFAHVFADLKRAPEGVAERMRAIPGVNQVETRVQAPVRLEVPGFPDPVRGHITSIPDGRQPDVNRLHLREGALPESGRSDQVAISEPFAEAHGLRAGAELLAIINGRLESLMVSGVVLSPEWVYQIGPADLLPDYERFGVLWMNRRALANAFDMDGAFNSVAITLQAGAPEESVIDALDEILAPYGGIGAHGRDDQLSHRFLTEELNQLRAMAIILPAIFLGVSAFLLSVLMGRIIHTQRQQVAVLKAFGYSNRDMAVHYGLLTGCIVLLGSMAGVGFGAVAGDALAEVYMEYFRFPELSFRLQARVVLLGVFVAGAAAMLGTFRAVNRAVSLAPAEAMRPPAPETYRQGWLERSRYGRLFDQPTRIIVRNLARHRLKASLSVLGIGLSAALLAAVAGGLALWLGRRRTATVALVAVLVGAIAVTIPYNWRAQARSVPPIHDISTDTTTPPEFVAIAPLREDAPNPVEYAGEETARAQHEGYPDIRTVWTERPPGDVFSAAVEVVTRMGWELVETDAGEGRIEATDITRWFGFKDDVVIRLTADQGGTLIDVRSKSRVGTSDVGTNAERIRAFLRRLEGALEN